MKQLIAVLIMVVVIIGVIVTLHLVQPKKPRYVRKVVYATDTLSALNPEQEGKLLFYLTKQLGTYEGAFEVINVVNLQTRDISGSEYILVTLRAPNGSYCQVILTRKSYPWAQWHIEEKSFAMVEIPSAKYTTTTQKDLVWMKDLGITPEEVSRYLSVHPEKALGDVKAVFVDRTTGSPALPSDWWRGAKIGESAFRYKMEIGKNKTMRFVSEMKQETSDLYWKVDYPSDYMGPGYRGYLFDKTKGQ